MSGLLVHAVVPAAAERPAVAGLRGRPLRWVEADALGACATAWPGQPDDLGRDDLFAHHRIVEALGPCLPVRFGTCVADDGALARLLGARQPSLLATMARVAGQRELAVTALWRAPSAPEAAPAPPPAEGGPGRRYLEERRARWRERDRRDDLAGRLARAIDGLGLPADAVMHRLNPAAAVALSSALLVPSAAAEALGARVAALGELFPEVRLLVNGPWPPYSFVASLESEP